MADPSTQSSAQPSKSQSPTASSSSATPEKGKDSILKPFTRKNWDAIIDEFEKEEEKDQSVNDLFKQIYESGNDEVRKAMNKSFQESGGTVLSTNWANVANQKVQPKPPSDNDKPAA